jgi:acyl-coenzyme A synthetase/AMP-(fatty) acid ligase
VPIGRVVAGVRAHVVDPVGRAVPDGEPGELLLGGDCLSWGYLGAAPATAESFIPDGWSGEPGSRLYRTGDRVLRRADGILEFLGRLDDQVKIRDVRIEPSDVEHELLRHPALEQAAVVVLREDARGEGRAAPRLVAHLAPAEGGPTDAELRMLLAERLPEAALPSAYVRHPRLPRLSSGKIDRRSLADASAAVPAAAPTGDARDFTRTQQRVARIWAELLGVAPADRRADFFQMGGQSLLAMRMIARVRDGFGVRLPARAILRAPTLEQFAAELDSAVAVQGAPDGSA